MTGPEQRDWVLLDRYLAGECAEAERRALEARLDDDSALRSELEVVRLVRRAGRDPAPEWHLDSVWRGVVQRTAAAQDPARIQVPGRPSPRRGIAASRGWLRAPARAAAAVLVVALAGIGTYLLSPIGQRTDRVYTTARGERTTVTLPDGTELALAPESRLRLAAGYGAPVREVSLEGEAVFTVVHDDARPFIVRTAQAVARDLGTTFDVSAYPSSSTTRIVVAQGHVDVRGIALGAGQVAIVEKHGRPRVESGIQPERYLGWRTGTLVFDATPVPEALATISRWYDMDVRASDSTVAVRHITATYTRAPIEEVLTTVAATLGASVERRGRVVRLIPFAR